jgi:hypothetical protein
MAKSETTELFFPYYINQSRLLDLYAILNGGYAEYEEIESTSSRDKKKSGSAKADVSGGFRILKIGGVLNVDGESSKSEQTSLNSKIVQTPTSMLSTVTKTLTERGYIRDLMDSTEGSFVIVPVVLKINSIKALIDEASSLLTLSEKMKALGSSQVGKTKNPTLDQVKKISGIVHELFGSEEIVYESNDFALIGSISEESLYQSNRADIIGTKLHCLAQVKRIFPNGTQLMKNTTFTKIQDKESKAALIESLRKLTEDSNFDYECDAIPEIQGKPVYQLEIVALYQTSKISEQQKA